MFPFVNFGYIKNFNKVYLMVLSLPLQLLLKSWSGVFLTTFNKFLRQNKALLPNFASNMKRIYAENFINPGIIKKQDVFWWFYGR